MNEIAYLTNITTAEHVIITGGGEWTTEVTIDERTLFEGLFTGVLTNRIFLPQPHSSSLLRKATLGKKQLILEFR